MLVTRSIIWRLVLFTAAVTCSILGRANDEQRLLLDIAAGIFVFAIVVLWYADNHRKRSLRKMGTQTYFVIPQSRLKKA